MEGTILAPNAAVNFINGQFNGTLIADSVSGAGESHWDPFIGVLPAQPVPEPASIVLAGCGVAGIGLVRYFRRRAGK